MLWLSESFQKPTVTSFVFVVGTFCTCNIKVECTRYCASDLDLFCFKHIPPSIESAPGGGPFRAFRTLAEQTKHVHESEPRWSPHTFAKISSVPSHLSIWWGPCVFPGDSDKAEEVIPFSYINSQLFSSIGIQTPQTAGMHSRYRPRLRSLIGCLGPQQSYRM